MNVFLYSAGLTPFAAQLARGLTKRFCRVVLATDVTGIDELKRNSPRFLSSAGFNWHPLSHATGIAPRIRRAVGVLRHVHQHRTRVFHLVTGNQSWDIRLVVLGIKAMKIPLVITLHDAGFHLGESYTRSHFERYVANLLGADQLIVHGKEIAGRATRDLGIVPEHLSIIPHGNYDILRESAPHNPDRFHQAQPTILFFGRMVAYKGLSTLLGAARLLAITNPQARIVIAGTGPDLVAHLDQCASLPNIVVHNRFIEWSEGKRLFASAFCVVVPYIEASQSGPLNIAFSFGIPVVASSTGALPEVLTHEREGLLVPPQNPEMLARALGTLLSNPELAAVMGRMARKKARTDLAWEGNIALGTLSVYEKARRHSICGRSAHYRKNFKQKSRLYYHRHLKETFHTA